LKNAVSLPQGYGRQASGLPRPFVVLTYYEYAPRVIVPATLLSAPF